MKLLREQSKQRQSSLATRKTELAVEKKVHALLLAASDYILENDPIRSMEEIVTDVLRQLINPNISRFNIRTVEKRNQLETYFTVTRKFGGQEIEQPIDGTLCGGGIDVAFFLIRLILLVNHPSRPRRVLFTDEPVKNLSRDKRVQFMELLKKIVKEFGIQLIMTTHEDQYIEGADAVWEFTLKGDATHAKTA